MSNSRARSALRMALLLAAILISAFVMYLGVGALTMGKASHVPRLTVQGIALLSIGGVSVLGTALSALAPKRLVQSARLRRGVVCVALALPVIDIYALLPDGGFTRALLSQVLVSAVVALVVTLAIATAWLEYFQGDSKLGRSGK